MEGQETKNTAFVNAPETLTTLMSAAVMARLHHVETFVEVIIRRRLLANDGDLYFLQKKGQNASVCAQRLEHEVPYRNTPFSSGNTLATSPRASRTAEMEQELVH